MKSYNDFKNQIDEVLTKKTPLSQWIHDFVHSDDPKFAGKSKEERIKMAQGAYYGAQKESVEEEVKKPTGPLKKACWKGYTAVGLKMKNGRKVPNCVPVKEDGSEITIGEGKMAELHASLSRHLDKHVAEYKRAGGAESLGHKSTVAAQKISKEHGIASHHAQQFVNDYIENKLKESMKEDIKAEHIREAAGHLVHVSDGSKYDETPHKKDIEHVQKGAFYHGGKFDSYSGKGAFFKFRSKEDADNFKRHVDKCPHKSCYADHVSEAVEYKGIGTDVVDKKKKLNPQPNLMSTKKTVKDFKEEVDEELNLIEAMTEKDKLRQALDRHTEKAVAANKAGDHDAVKVHQGYINKIKTKMGKLAKEETETPQEYQAKKKEQLKKYDWVEKLYKNAPKDVKDKAPVKEEVDLTEDIKKEYDSLKKHDIKTLRGMIKQQHRVVDTSEFRTKEHAISHILNNKHGNKRVMAALHNEEVEQIDELSKSTLASYVQKAHKDNAMNANDLGHQLGSAKEPGHSFNSKYLKQKGKYIKRSDSIDKAVSKLAKEDVELEESRGHKVIATFLKNREIAQRAFNKPVETPKEPEKKDKKLNKEGVSMLNFNDFLKEGKCGSMKKEELKGNQHKLDKNKNGKLDADDFKKLRGENKDCDYEEEGFVSHAQRKAVWASKNEKGVKEEVKKKDLPFDPDPKPAKKVTPGKYGQGYSQAKHLAQKGLKSLTKEDLDQFSAEDIEEFMMSEDYDQLDEISKATLASYIPKAARSARIHGQISTEYKKASERKKKPGLVNALNSLSTKYKQKAWDREANIKKAVGKLAKEDLELTMDELVEYMQTEAWTQLDELSKKTLGSYVKKASGDLASSIHYERDAEETDDKDAAGAFAHRAGNRILGLQRAGKKIAKEEVEQIDEAKYAIDVHRNKLSKLLTHASNAGIKAKVVSHNPNWEKQNAGGEHVVHLHGKDEHVRKFIQKHHDNDPQATDDYKEYGKSVKEEVELDEVEQVSYKDMMSRIEEGKIDDYLDRKRADANTASAYSDKKKPAAKSSSVTINKGRAYGGAAQKDDEGDEKPETTEKRGRGRPTGSKSGARQKGNGHNDGGIQVHNLNLPTRNNKF